MSNDLMTYQPSQDQIDLIKRTYFAGATNDELSMFLHYVKRTGLDPMARQIYAMKRKQKNDKTGFYEEKMTTQVSIDGQRLVAERTGKYAGQVGPFWCGRDGAWRDVWLESESPAACKVGILRTDFKEPVWGIALFSEYCQGFKDGGTFKLNNFWSTKGSLMIAKCAESLGLRKAFPMELSGLYSDEELGNEFPQEEKTITATSEVAIIDTVTDEQLAELALKSKDAIAHLKWKGPQFAKFSTGIFPGETWAGMTNAKKAEVHRALIQMYEKIKKSENK